MKIKYLASAVLSAGIAGIVVVVLATSGGSAKTRAPQSVAAGSAISVRSTSFGQTLTDANGRTLYLFEGDRTNVSTLSSAGLAVWPRFVASGTVKAGPGAQAAKIGTVTGPSGTRQVSYNGHPLYYYVGDAAPGSTRGEGLNEFGARWYVLSAAGNAITNAPSNASSGTSALPPSFGY